MTWKCPGVGTLKATMINAGIPTIFVNADAIGYTGTELQEAINSDGKALAMFENIRAHGAIRMGLIKTLDEAAKRQHTPKVAFVAPPKSYVSSSGKHVQAGDDRSAGARVVDGQAASRDDGHGCRCDRHGCRDSWHAGESRRGWRRAEHGSLRSSVRHAASRRRGQQGQRRMDGHQGHHEPQRRVLMEGWVRVPGDHSNNMCGAASGPPQL